MINHKYPYTDFHELNLDYVINKIVELDKLFHDDITEEIRERVSKLFVDSMYIPETETLLLQLKVGE